MFLLSANHIRKPLSNKCSASGQWVLDKYNGFEITDKAVAFLKKTDVILGTSEIVKVVLENNEDYPYFDNFFISQNMLDESIGNYAYVDHFPYTYSSTTNVHCIDDMNDYVIAIAAQYTAQINKSTYVFFDRYGNEYRTDCSSANNTYRMKIREEGSASFIELPPFNFTTPTNGTDAVELAMLNHFKNELSVYGFVGEIIQEPWVDIVNLNEYENPVNCNSAYLKLTVSSTTPYEILVPKAKNKSNSTYNPENENYGFDPNDCGLLSGIFQEGGAGFGGSDFTSKGECSLGIKRPEDVEAKLVLTGYSEQDNDSFERSPTLFQFLVASDPEAQLHDGIEAGEVDWVAYNFNGQNSSVLKSCGRQGYILG